MRTVSPHLTQSLLLLVFLKMKFFWKSWKKKTISWGNLLISSFCYSIQFWLYFFHSFFVEYIILIKNRILFYISLFDKILLLKLLKLDNLIYFHFFNKLSRYFVFVWRNLWTIKCLNQAWREIIRLNGSQQSFWWVKEWPLCWSRIEWKSFCQVYAYRNFLSFFFNIAFCNSAVF